MPTFMKERLRKFGEARKGNAAMMFALGAPILVLGLAVAIDFSNASIVKTKLNAAADAAALAALTPAMMAQTDTQAQTAAYAVFDARADSIGSLVVGQTSRTAKVTDPNGLGSRQVLFTYSAQTNTILGGFLGQSSMTVSGSSTAQASIPPNINFYLLLDNSPSMSLPSTSAGLTSMQNMGNGCAFACHEAAVNSASAGDTMFNLCTDGTSPQFPACTTGSGTGKGSVANLKAYCTADPYCTTTINNSYTSKYTAKSQMDNYAMARNSSIPLRLDELSAGISTLMTTANNYHNSGLYATPPVYQFAAYSMDSSWQIGVTNTRVMALTSNYISSWATNSSSFGVMEMYSNNNVCSTAACTASGGVGDVETNFDNALGDINKTMVTPGNGTNQTGDTPQEVLFFVTDGVEDEATSTCSQPLTNGRCQAPINTALCTTIKNRGIKIAVLYTQYLPVTSNTWYNSWIAPFQSTIATNLQACASPNLFNQVTFGDNIGAALSTLFNTVTQQAALSN
jgi:Flp pilus assembly protein TadG